MTDLPFVSVIVPTYRDWGRLVLCLQALQQQDYPRQSFEILIVNNAPEIEPPAAYQLPANARILTEAKPGSYAARNKAVGCAQGDLFAFTDSDCTPSHDWLSQAVAYFSRHKEMSRIAGRVKIAQNESNGYWANIYESVFAFPQPKYAAEGCAITANMIARKAVFDSVGLFDQSLMSGGDLEWGIRANAAGFPIAYVESVVVHHPARSVAEIVQKAKRIAGGNYAKIKHRGLAYRVLFVLMDLLPPLNSFRVVLSKRHIKLRDKLAALLFRCYLKWVSLVEKARLLLGKVPERT